VNQAHTTETATHPQVQQNVQSEDTQGQSRCTWVSSLWTFCWTESKPLNCQV